MSWIAVGVVGGVAAGAIGANKAGKSAGSGRNLQEETESTLEQQIRLAPQVYAAESSAAYGQPAYARLQRRMLDESLFGTEQARGLLDIYGAAQPQLSELDAAYQSATRENNLADVKALAGGYQEAFDAANPRLTEQLNRLSTDLNESGGRTDVENALEAEAARRVGDRGTGPTALEQQMQEQAGAALAGGGTEIERELQRQAIDRKSVGREGAAR